MAVVIHRATTAGGRRWFEIRGRRYELVPGADHVRDGWGYEIAAPDGTWMDANLLTVDDVRAWAQEYVDNPEWGYPEDETAHDENSPDQ